MPTAGAVIPPVIVPLRKPVPGVPTTHIDTATFVELETDTPDCQTYFTTDGTKPNPFQQRVAGREVTFKYKGPFTLKPGKRTIKAVALANDGIRESNVVTKTFVVDDVGPPNEDAPLTSPHDTDEIDSLFNSARTMRKSTTFTNTKKKTLKKNTRNKLRESAPAPKEAWITDTKIYDNDFSSTYPTISHATEPTHHSSVQLPADGTWNPTNYSGTQVNFWGVSPNAIPAVLGGGYNMPYGDRPTQLGYLTQNMLNNLDQPKVSINDMKRMLELQRLQQQQQQQPPPPAIEAPPPPPPKTEELELTDTSPGKGDWKGNLKHMYAHLMNQCKSRIPFRTAVGAPKLGKIVTADFDEEDDVYLLTVSFKKPGAPNRPTMKKAATVAKAVTKKPVKEPVKEEPKAKPKPKPKTEKKPEPKKEDPYFETEEYEQEGTLKPWEAFNAERDCEALRKAMKGLGTDEKAIIDILGYRSSVQREEICTMFKTMFGKDLRKELDGETSGNFGEALLALCMPAADYDASEIRKAVKGLGTDDDALIEILCTRTNKQIQAMKEAYQRLYGKEMEKDVRGDTSGHFKKLLTSQIQANREESATFDRTAAKQDAKALYEAGEKKWGTDESTFNMILCQRSFPHLRAVFEEYKNLSKKDMEDVIKSEFSGDIKNGLLTVVRCIKDKPMYFARKLQKAMKGLGTDDSALIRVVVSRCECDMVQIMAAFQKLTNGTLADWIADDTSGDYKELLHALIGARAAPVPSAEEIAEAQAEPELEEVEEEQYEEEGTLKPADPFDPNKDCEILRKAMKGLGTDEAAIINVMAKRSNAQRLELVKQYKTMYGKDLMKELKSETSGNFCQILKRLCMGRAEMDAYELRKAMKGLGTDEDCLIEILCTRSKEELAAIVQTYQTMHNRKLEDDIISETSGHLKRLLVSMVQANRPEGNVIDRRKARQDAAALHEAGEKSWGTDESRFNVILCSRSYPQLRATFEEYQKLTNKDIEDSIKSEMSGDIKSGMLTIVRCVRNKAAQFARRLEKSMAGLGTDDDTLIRIVVSRCEIDMVQIKEHFQTAYKQRLGQYIYDDTSGDYRKTLLTLTGDEDLIKK